MSTPSNPHWLFDRWRRRRDDSLADAADLGTAFGLELTLIPGDDEPSAPRPAAASGGATRWLRRLMRRQAD